MIKTIQALKSTSAKARIIVALLIFIVFGLTVFIGVLGENESLKKVNKESKEQVREIDLLLKGANAKIELLKDSTLYYTLKAERSEKLALTLRQKSKILVNETNKKINAIDTVSTVNVPELFTKLAEQYRQRKGENN